MSDGTINLMQRLQEHLAPLHQWDVGVDGWGVVLGVSRCKRCATIATQDRLGEKCDGVSTTPVERHAPKET